MKYFTEPQGLFKIKIPVDWQYVNVAAGIEEKSPYSFQHYENSTSSFQISCNSKPKDWSNKFTDHPANTDKISFIKQRMDDEDFNIYLWFANVEDHYFIIKFICDAGKENTLEIIDELNKVEQALTTLEFLTGENRELAIELDIYEKFMASLAASFDLLNKAMENIGLIEIVILIANQIDAYLRMSIVLIKQLNEVTDRIDTTLLVQRKQDRPVMEKEIYRIAKDLGIIDSTLYNILFTQYGERNKVVHRYIISDFKTRDLMRIVMDYDQVCEKVRLRLKDLEDQQFQQKIGIYGKRDPHDMPNAIDVQMLFSQVNDKHLYTDFFRKI